MANSSSGQLGLNGIPDQVHKGHAAHFLHRLERASATQTELALQLYQDPELLSHIIAHLSLPDDVERVALSLEGDDGGPYLILTNRGDFVTCLGRGMSAANLEIVAHSRLQAIMRKQKIHQQRLEMAKQVVGNNFKKLLGRTILTGRTITREHFMAAAALQPIVKYDFIECLAKYDDAMREVFFTTAGAKGIKNKHHTILDKFWHMHWAMGPLALLFAMEDDGKYRPDEAEAIAHILLYPCRWGVMSLVLSSAWAIGKIGKPLLAPLKRVYNTARTDTEWFGALMGLLAIATRHRKLQAEVRKIILPTASSVQRFPPLVVLFLGKNTKQFYELVLLNFSITDATFPLYLEKQRESVFEMCKEANCDISSVAKTPAELPEKFVKAFFFNQIHDIRKENDMAHVCLMYLPLVIRSEAADFFPSKQWWPFTFEKEKPIKGAWELLTKTREYMLSCIPFTPKKYKEDNAFEPTKYKMPVRNKQQQTGANQPCPCGSGRKYKRCCRDKASDMVLESIGKTSYSDFSFE